jgi:hypothetical protein
VRYLMCAAVALSLGVLFVESAQANRRAIRIDGFADEWTDVLAIGTADCPGTQLQSTLVQRFGYTFSGRQIADHLTDTYCQKTNPGGLSQSSITYVDETGLAQLIGPNEDDRVSAIRYSFLDRNRFDFDVPPSGFQWIFYQFERGDTDTMIAGLYGLQSVTLSSSTFLRDGPDLIWDASGNSFDGSYFCFEDGIYLDRWDGSLPSTSACARGGLRIFRGAFE